MAISKIIYKSNASDAGTAWMNVTDTTATAPTVEAGLYFYGADGEKTLGTGSGGGTVEAVEKDVNFIDDYDGIIVYSYTAAEFANLSAMPANPTHAGMTSQGWNWTLADAKTYVANYGKLWIGQQYVTTSGDTEIDICLEKGRTSPYLGLAVNGSVSIDWGDGTTSSTVTGTSLTTQVRTLHNYPAESAVYTIKISVISGEFAFYGTTTYPIFSGNASSSNNNRVYSNAVKFIRLGTNVKINNYGFVYLHSLERVTMPSSMVITSLYIFQNCDSLKTATLSQNMTYTPIGIFYYCSSLKRASMPKDLTEIKNSSFAGCRCIHSVALPSGITSIGPSGLYGCYGLSSVTIPSAVSTIEASAIGACYGLGEIHFAPSTPPTVDNSNAFGSLPTDCVIYVPYSADHSILNSYKTATNYPDPNTYTYTEESA